MHLDSLATYYVGYAWVAIVYVGYIVSLSRRWSKARNAERHE